MKMGISVICVVGADLVQLTKSQAQIGKRIHMIGHDVQDAEHANTKPETIMPALCGHFFCAR